MNFQLFHQSLFPRIVQALSWTLIHSLWQGFVVVILIGTVLIFTQKSRAVVTYNLLCSILFLFVLASFATFWIEYGKTTPSKVSAFTGLENVNEVAVFRNYIPSNNSNVFDSTNIENRIINFFSSHADLIVAIWFVIFLFKFLKIVLGISYLNQIRRKSVSLIETNWSLHLETLGQKLGIKIRVLLAESAMVTVPIVHGVFIPIIIVPLGFLSNLPFHQVEAILLHELAHIKRKDYLINLLQSFLESIFFFNPAVFWLSELIRREREYCCDDIAISVLDNKVSLVNALVSFQEYKEMRSRQMIAFSDKTNRLFIRIKRLILTNNYKNLNAMEKIFVTTSVLITIFLTAAFSTNELIKAEKNEKNVTPNTIVSQKENRTSVVKEESSQIHRSVEGANLKLNVNDSLPTLNALSPESIEAKKQLDLIRQEIQELFKNSQKRWAALTESKSQKIESGLRSDAFQKNSVNQDDEKLTAENSVEKSSLKVRTSHDELNLVLAKMKTEVLKIDSARVNETAEKVKLMQEQYEARQSELLAAEVQASKTYRTKMQEELISDLIAIGAIKNTENLSFKLHNKFLIVNNKVQPEAIQKIFKAKYLDRDWAEWLYNFDGKTGYFWTSVRYPY